MDTMRFALLFLFAGVAFAQDPVKEELIKRGHSHQGEAFDSGPRQKPWVIEGIGSAHFPITTQNPEVQKWFDQGNALIHSFWFYEAERAFRWCLKLEPENAMAWWGMYRAAENPKRQKELLKEAVKRKQTVSDRERMYIEASMIVDFEDPLDTRTRAEKNQQYVQALERIVLKYPEDLEAKSYLGLAVLFQGPRLTPDLILKDVIAKAPMHPGAHHYRIHNWNYLDGEQALDSCALYSEIAYGIGHAQHMPGHVYATVGMWQEAAISMDAATRVEKEYMRTRLILPWDDWNYSHNANYLSYIHTQLGMADRAISGARQLLAVAHDPQGNVNDIYSNWGAGAIAMMRALIRFERWDDLLNEKTFEWKSSTQHKAFKAYTETIAYLAKGQREKAEKAYAEHKALKADAEKIKNYAFDQNYAIQALELKGRLELAAGRPIEGLATLTDAAAHEDKLLENQNDPPFYPIYIANLLGDAYLGQKSPALAAQAYERTLKKVRGDGFALAGLVEAYSMLGDQKKAANAMGRLLQVWGDADAGIKPLERARSLVPNAKPIDDGPARQRNYIRTSLERLGPNVWQDFPAPTLDVNDAKGKQVTLDQYKGKNVLLIFYLGSECAHCIEQLKLVAKKKFDLAGLDTEVLAVSSASIDTNAASQKVGDLPFSLLTDTSFANARRFKSYDDFEDLELHSTTLIDKQGRIHWSRIGGDPFTDVDFLLKELARMNASANEGSPRLAAQ